MPESEKHVSWVKYTTCLSLNIFLEGCVNGCRSQWQIVRNDYDEKKTNNILFDCFLYVFCQHQFSYTLDHIVGILDDQDLKHLKSEYEDHFKPFNIVANGMKHLNRMVGELFKRDEKQNIVLYNLVETKLNFGETSAECIDEEPLLKTEQFFLKSRKIIQRKMNELREMY